MRNINLLVVHCTATKEGKEVTVADIDKMHKARKFAKIGYHYVIYLDGSIHTGRKEEEIGAHVKGHNEDSLGIVYVGGLDSQGKPKDTRTEKQKESLKKLLKELKVKYPKAKILGHRDLSLDLNHNGVIEPKEWIKACPCFNAIEEYKDI